MYSLGALNRCSGDKKLRSFTGPQNTGGRGFERAVLTLEKQNRYLEALPPVK
jgi:hypothetical protein